MAEVDWADALWDLELAGLEGEVQAENMKDEQRKAEQKRS